MVRMTWMGFAAAAATIGVVLTGCGSGGDSEATSETSSASSTSSDAETTTSSAAPETSTAAAGPGQTVQEYLDGEGITQTLVTRGDPGIPTLNLPMPEGWEDVGADTPADAYGAIYLVAGAEAPNPPAIIARMARLSGPVDQATVLELAPNALRNQPGYEGPETGQESELGGYPAAAIAGTVIQDGAPVFVARKTVVIEGQDGTYLLALDAQGSPDQQPALLEAMSVIDAETTIEP